VDDIVVVELMSTTASEPPCNCRMISIHKKEGKPTTKGWLTTEGISWKLLSYGTSNIRKRSKEKRTNIDWSNHTKVLN